MKINLAKSAGFCFGVDRAVKKIETLLNEGNRVCTLGPLIHNPGFINGLKKRGVLEVNDPSLCPTNYTIVVRTHGVEKNTYDFIKSNNMNFVDVTCPYVSKIHKIVSRHSTEDSTVLIAGDKEHPEIIGIMSYCKGKAFAFRDSEELLRIFECNAEIIDKKLILLSQTTFGIKEFQKCIKKLNLLYTNPIIFDTICSATAERQNEAVELSLVNDMMIVIGGRNSSNTKKLAIACEENCNTFLIESASELYEIDFSNCKSVGVTAGASTPACNIKEVLKTMSEIVNGCENNEEIVTATNQQEDADEQSDVSAEQQNSATDVLFEELPFEEALEESLKNMNTNQKVVGTVLRIAPNEIQVDIVGRKQTGYIPIEEYSANENADPSKELNIGDELNLIIMKTNDVEGTIMLSKRRFDATKHWDAIVSASKDGTTVSGHVVEVVSKGVIVSSNGIRVFIPASLATESRNDRLEDLLDKDVEFQVIEIDRRRRRTVGSIRAVLKAKKKVAADKFWESAEVGAQLNGVVKSLTSFAAFVDLGGVDGMIHKSELSWKRIQHPSEIVNVGDAVTVTIKSLDREKKKISLSFKKLEDNPWEILRRDYPVGSIVDVKITGLTTFGAFAQLFPGIEGLIHISQISSQRIAKPQDILSIGDIVKVMVTGIDFEKKRLSLSIRALIDPPVDEQENDLTTESTIDDEPTIMSIDDLLATSQEDNKEKED